MLPAVSVCERVVEMSRAILVSGRSQTAITELVNRANENFEEVYDLIDSVSDDGSGPVTRSGIISPAALAAGTTSNYAPTGLATCNTMRVTPDAGGSVLSGILAASFAQEIVLYNIGAGDLTLAHDATSTAANRFLCPGSVDRIVIANESVTIWYDLTSARWRIR